VRCDPASNYQKKMFDHANRLGVPDHKHLIQLEKYAVSDYLTFLVKLRPEFMKMYKKFSESEIFPHIDAEALWLATVMHSMDHSQLSDKIDPLILDGETAYPEMASATQVIIAGFTDELPGLLFPTKFRDSPLKFFQAVYKKAVEINPRFAEVLETCVVR